VSSESVPAGEPQTAYNLLRWLGHCGGTKYGILRKLYWAIFAADDTLVAKGHGQQEFFDMFGTKNRGTYQRLVSNIDVGQRTIFNPSTPTDISPAYDPFLVERHSGVGFDELEQLDSDLFTKLIVEYPSPAPISKSCMQPWIVIDNSSGSSLTVIAKGRGQQAFFNLFGTKNKSVYQRLVSSVKVGEQIEFNPSFPTDISPADAPYLVERHSGVGFDKLEPELRTPIIKVGIDQEHPMMKLLVNSGKKCSPKLIKHISIGTVKKLFTTYFVPEQTMKLSNKFLKSVVGCEQLSTNVLSGCFPFMSDLMDMEQRYQLRSL